MLQLTETRPLLCRYLKFSMIAGLLFTHVGFADVAPTSGAAFSCYDQATSGAGLDMAEYLSGEQALRLCRGAKNHEPIRCYKKMMSSSSGIPYGYYLSKPWTVELCRGSIDADETVACYARVAKQMPKAGPGFLLSPTEGVELCGPPR